MPVVPVTPLPRRARQPLAVVAALAVVAPLAACGTGGTAASAPAAATTAAASPSACPSPSATAAAWPAGVPRDFPRFAGQTVNPPTQEAGSTVVQFGLPLELDAATALVRQQLPAAGYPVKETDGEAGKESDTKFDGKGASGRVKVIKLDACGSRAILAVSASASASAHHAASPSATASP